MMHPKTYIPSVVSILRFISAPLLFYTFIIGQFPLSAFIILFAALTDIMDGCLARRWDAVSTFGAYLDVTADFVLVFLAFFAMASAGWYSNCVLGLISLSFFLFLATSRSKKPIYDPMGKYLGSYMMGMVFLSVLFPQTFLRQILLFILVLMVIISTISRLLYLTGRIEI
ncbi:MAG TPA: CDP-alcohol phosphatidyltransferase family protein [Methanobacteriaceae archaeon]|nr:CDP-alcohol phosphatidyltransferase family protein [Methanobacteriaceae archaeon]